MTDQILTGKEPLHAGPFRFRPARESRRRGWFKRRISRRSPASRQLSLQDWGVRYTERLVLLGNPTTFSPPSTAPAPWNLRQPRHILTGWAREDHFRRDAIKAWPHRRPDLLRWLPVQLFQAIRHGARFVCKACGSAAQACDHTLRAARMGTAYGLLFVRRHGLGLRGPSRPAMERSPRMYLWRRWDALRALQSAHRSASNAVGLNRWRWTRNKPLDGLSAIAGATPEVRYSDIFEAVSNIPTILT